MICDRVNSYIIKGYIPEMTYRKVLGNAIYQISRYLKTIEYIYSCY